jgi:hypothetical protein
LKVRVLIVRQEIAKQTGECRSFDEFHVRKIYANGG